MRAARFRACIGSQDRCIAETPVRSLLLLWQGPELQKSDCERHERAQRENQGKYKEVGRCGPPPAGLVKFLGELYFHGRP